MEVRGEEWETEKDCIVQRTYTKKLILKHDDGTIRAIFTQLHEKDFKWSKPENKYKINAYVVYTEAPTVLQQLRKAKISPVQTPVEQLDFSTAVCIDTQFQVWQVPGDDREWILWDGQFMTEDEANERGYNGGGGLYIRTRYNHVTHEAIV